MPLVSVRKALILDKKEFQRAFVTRGGVILVNLEPQLQRMMFQWNEKHLSSPRHLSTEPNPRFPLSCAHQPPPKYPCRSEDRFKNSLSSLNLGLCPHHHQVAPSYHIITDLSAGVFGEVMHKLPSTLVQHDSLHSHYSTSCISIVKTLTLSKYVQLRLLWSNHPLTIFYFQKIHLCQYKYTGKN